MYTVSGMIGLAHDVDSAVALVVKLTNISQNATVRYSYTIQYLPV